VDNRAEYGPSGNRIISQVSDCGSIAAGLAQGWGRDRHAGLPSRVANSVKHLGASMRNIELADVALAVATIFLMCAVLLASMPGWH